jgi:predicted Fe-S protein YdhL (DUF1289 family)
MIVESPCVKICALDARQVCIGCLRTLDEIASWESMGHAARMAVLERIRREAAERAADPEPRST